MSAHHPGICTLDDASADGRQTLAYVAHRREKEPIIRLNLLRALRLDRRLALACTFAGLLLAVASAIFQWPAYTVKNKIYDRPAQSRATSLSNDGHVAIDSVPGAVHESVEAEPLLRSSFVRILRAALPLALVGLLAGLLAAVIRKKLDLRIYIAADIEDALGFAPIAVLPDFEEVSDGVTAECLLRLTAALELIGRKGNLRTCIITGSSRHTGVTTIAERIKNTLCAMGRPAVLLDATGHGRDEFHETAGTTALLKQLDSRAEIDAESIVLVDTPPLALSTETEYFARSVDGALVIVRSGVTTRAQLLATANTLQRLGIRAVGFVLNQVSLSYADQEFRHSLEDMEKHLRSQGDSSSMWRVRWHGFLNDPPRKPESAVEDLSAERAEPAGDTTVQRMPNTVVEFLIPTAEAPSPPKSALPNVAETPWWLLPNTSPAHSAPAQSCAVEPVKSEYPASAPPRIQPPKLPDWFWEGGPGRSGNFMRLPAAENAQSALEPMQTDAEARIERLRGLLANVGLATLHRNRGSVAQDEDLPREEQVTEQLPSPELKIAAQQDSPESPGAPNQSEAAVAQPAPGRRDCRHESARAGINFFDYRRTPNTLAQRIRRSERAKA